jgi:hypothetical protein
MRAQEAARLAQVFGEERRKSAVNTAEWHDVQVL